MTQDRLPAVLRGYQPGPLDEAVDPDLQVRPGYVPIMAALDAIGIDGLRAATRRLDQVRTAEGIDDGSRLAVTLAVVA